jgi:streptogramin lyase
MLERTPRTAGPVRLAFFGLALFGVLWFCSAATAEPVTVATTAGPPISTPEMVVSVPPSHELRGVGADGSGGVWFAEDGETHDAAYLVHYQAGQLGLTRKLVKPLTNFSQLIDGIAPGPDGNEWFARFYDDRISHVDATGRLLTKALSTGSNPDSLVVGNDGTVWFGERGHGCSVGRLTPAGKLSSYSVGGDCGDLAVGPDGNIWIATYSGNRVVELSASSGAILASYAVPLPIGIAAIGTKIWVTEAQPSHIASISPTGDIAEYVLPGEVGLEWATAGPDDALWFSETGQSAIGRLSASGELSETPIPGGGNAGRLASSGGAIYFTAAESGGQQGLMRVWSAGSASSDNASYVSLGDSYSSGEGNPPYAPGTDDHDAPDLCHRSSTAYAPLLDGAAGLGPPVYGACSGAVTNDVFQSSGKYPTEPPQRSRLRANTKTVTLTIGGNDAGFAHVLEECITVTQLAPLFQHFGCASNKGLETEAQARLAALSGGAYATTPPPLSQPIHSVLSVLEAIHAEAPSARVLIGLYPTLFGRHAANYAFNTDAPSGSACEVGNFGGAGLWIDYGDAQWLNKLAKQLNAIITTAAQTATNEGITVEPVNPAKFATHGFCDEHERWFYPLELEVHNLFEVGPELAPKPSSFHPTAAGQQIGYENAFAAKMK